MQACNDTILLLYHKPTFRVSEHDVRRKLAPSPRSSPNVQYQIVWSDQFELVIYLEQFESGSASEALLSCQFHVLIYKWIFCYNWTIDDKITKSYSFYNDMNFLLCATLVFEHSAYIQEVATLEITELQTHSSFYTDKLYKKLWGRG